MLKQRSFALPENTLTDLKEIAENLHITSSEIVRLAVAEKICELKKY